MGNGEKLPRRGRPEAAAVADVDALVQGMRDLRLALDVDLSVAAAAFDADEPALAEEVIAHDLRLVHEFEERARRQLAAPVPAQRRWSRRAVVSLAVVPAMTVAVAAAAVGVNVGGSHQSRPGTPTIAAATASYEELKQVANVGAAPQRVLAAAANLNATLAHLVATAGNNPDAAQAALQLLHLEQLVLLKQSTPGLSSLLQQAEQLVAALKAYVSPAQVAVVQRTQLLLVKKAAQHPSAPSTTAPSASPAPAPSPASTPTPAPSPSPSAAPSASPSPSPAGTLSPPLPSDGSVSTQQP